MGNITGWTLCWSDSGILSLCHDANNEIIPILPSAEDGLPKPIEPVASDCSFYTTTDFSSKFTQEWFQDVFDQVESVNPGLLNGDGYELWEELLSTPLGQQMLITDNPDCEIQWKRFFLDQSDAVINLEGNLRALATIGEAKEFRYVEDDPTLPMVLLLGDSISIGTWIPFQETYGGTLANIHTAPTNCGPFSKYENALEAWLGNAAWDIIQVNVGLHHLAHYRWRDDLAEAFDAGLKSVISKLREHSPDATIVFALTTPSPFDTPDTAPNEQICIGPAAQNWMRVLEAAYPPGMVSMINDRARTIAAEMGVLINDRYSAVLPTLNMDQIPCDIHFFEDGYRRLAESDWTFLSHLLL